MADNSTQYGNDTFASDDLSLINGGAVSGVKVIREKIGYGDEGQFIDVSTLNGLPVDNSESAIATVVLNSASASATIDTTGFSWVSIQVGTGMVGQTQLNARFSNDGTNWFNGAFSPSSATSSGITTSLGVTANLFHGPIAGRYMQLFPTGFTSGTQTNLVVMQSLPSIMPSVGSNTSTNLTGIASNIAPAIANSGISIGSSAGNQFQRRATGTGTQAATALVAAVSGQFIHITDIFWTYSAGGGATPANDITLLLQSAASGEPSTPSAGGHTIFVKWGTTDERHFRNPWKTSSVNNNALNLTVSGTVLGTWEVIVHGYFQT